MTAPATASTPSVCIATPSLDGSVTVAYTASLLGTQQLLQARGVPCAVHFEVGNSLIADARNQLVSRFLAGTATDLVFIDADIGWQPHDLLRLLAYPVPLVAGVYQRKSRSKTDFTVKFGPAIAADAHGLLPAERVGTGFLRLRRDCILRMVAAHPRRLANPARPGDANLYALFDTSIVNDQFVGEDYTFCDRWRAIGGQVLVDASIALSHHGGGVFDEPLSRYLRRD